MMSFVMMWVGCSKINQHNDITKYLYDSSQIRCHKKLDPPQVGPLHLFKYKKGRECQNTLLSKVFYGV